MRRQNVTAGCLNFAKSYFAVPDSGVACLWQNFNNLPSILPPRQNNPVAAVNVNPNISQAQKIPTAGSGGLLGILMTCFQLGSCEFGGRSSWENKF